MHAVLPTTPLPQEWNLSFSESKKCEKLEKTIQLNVRIPDFCFTIYNLDRLGLQYLLILCTLIVNTAEFLTHP
jgi:hypothetical protein